MKNLLAIAAIVACGALLAHASKRRVQREKSAPVIESEVTSNGNVRAAIVELKK